MEKVLADANGVPIQIAKYIHGVGDSPVVLEKVAGGSLRRRRRRAHRSRIYLRLAQLCAGRQHFYRRLQQRRVHRSSTSGPDPVGGASQAGARNRCGRQVRQRRRAWYRYRHGTDSTLGSCSSLVDTKAMRAARRDKRDARALARCVLLGRSRRIDVPEQPRHRGWSAAENGLPAERLASAPKNGFVIRFH